MATEKRLYSDLAVPPGEYLKEVLEELGLTQAALARRIGRSEQAISELVHGKRAITAEIALSLEEVTAVGAHVWMNLESGYRLTLARAHRRKAS